MGEASLDTSSSDRPPGDRLDSWKEIAAYLKRDVTTVQRWEKREGMPVHRHVHDRGGSVFAVTGELDAWAKSRSLRPEQTETKVGPEETPERTELSPSPTDLGSPSRHRFKLWVPLSGILLICLSVVISWLAIRRRETAGTVTASQIRSLAVLPLQNLSGDPNEEYFVDGITDALITELAHTPNLSVMSTLR